MAITKLGNSKSSHNSINYCDKKAEIKSGINCDVEIAKEQFKATRNIWGKNDGVQCHTIIQSFKPKEVSSELANKLGYELANKIAGVYGFEVGIYTHIDKEHIHNHIIINSVNFETGKKYNSDMKKLYEVKRVNDEICLKNGLSLATESPTPKINYTLSEIEILKKGKDSWKDEIRQAIDIETARASNYLDFKNRLEKIYGIKTNADHLKHITFTYPEQKPEYQDITERQNISTMEYQKIYNNFGYFNYSDIDTNFNDPLKEHLRGQTEQEMVKGYKSSRKTKNAAEGKIERKIRGNKLGRQYTREGIIDGIERYNRIREEQTRKRNDIRAVNERIISSERIISEGIRNKPTRESSSGIQYRNPIIDSEINSIRSRVHNLTASGRRETEDERRATERADAERKRVEAESLKVAEQARKQLEHQERGQQRIIAEEKRTATQRSKYRSPSL